MASGSHTLGGNVFDHKGYLFVCLFVVSFYSFGWKKVKNLLGNEEDEKRRGNGFIIPKVCVWPF